MSPLRLLRQREQRHETLGERAVAVDAQRARGLQRSQRLAAIDRGGDDRCGAGEDDVGAVGRAGCDLDRVRRRGCATNVSAPMRKPTRAANSPARAGSSMVRSDSSSDAGLNGKVGSCEGERDAQRPSA